MAQISHSSFEPWFTDSIRLASFIHTASVYQSFLIFIAGINNGSDTPAIKWYSFTIVCAIDSTLLVRKLHTLKVALIVELLFIVFRFIPKCGNTFLRILSASA